MQNDFNKGIENLKKLSLNMEDKKAILNNLVDHINRTPTKKFKSDFSWFAYLAQKQYFYAALVVLLITGSGVVLAASNGALPGDLLYPIKVNLSEPLEGVTMLSETSKVNWRAEVLNRRFEEVETLAAKGKLNPINQKVAEVGLTQAVDSLNKTLTAVASSSLEVNQAAEEAQIKVSVHDRILQKLENHSPAQKDQILELRFSVQGKNKSFNFKKQNSSASFKSEQDRVLNLIQNTEQNIQNAKKVSKNNLQADIISDTEVDLNVAKATLNEANEQNSSGEATSAVLQLNTSRRILENANAYLDQGIKVGSETGN